MDCSPGQTIEKVLNAVENSFGKCFIVCTGLPDSGGFAPVRLRSMSAPANDQSVSFSNGLSVPIMRTNGGNEETLGYLFLKAKDGREAFGPAEEKTFQKVASRLWTILVKFDGVESGKSAA